MDETIAAIATPPGEGGIGIIRISGPRASQVADRIIRLRNNQRVADQPTHSLRLGEVWWDGQQIDEVLVGWMPGPHSYTAEDVVEINCHGGFLAVQRVLEAVLASGARLAEPGEFTKRAFLNGRIDLSQAESVIDIIRASSDKSLEIANRQLKGQLSKRIKDFRKEVLHLLAFIEAGIDFPEEDLELLDRDEIKRRLDKLLQQINALLDTAGVGIALREGIKVVIAGKPNVGKSSLLNSLLKEQRAIVTDIPGTTRDTIEEVVNLGGVALRLIDTAGIRETSELVERLGVERSKEWINRADLVLLVLDGHTGISSEDKFLFRLVEGQRVIILINKSDLPSRIDYEELDRLRGDNPYLEISAKNQKGIDDLIDLIQKTVFQGNINPDDAALITRVRHKQCLEKAKKYLMDAARAIEEGLPEEFLSIDLQGALNALGEITGETVDEELLNVIFEEFCIGK